MSKLVVTNIETQNIKFDSDTTAFTIASDGSVTGTGSSDLVKISDTTATDVAQIDITTGFSSTYDTYYVVYDMLGATDGQDAYVQVFIGGSHSSAGAFGREVLPTDGGGTAGADTGSNNFIRLQRYGVGNATGEGLNGHFYIFNRNSTTRPTTAVGATNNIQDNGNHNHTIISGSQTAAYRANVIDGLRFLFSSGNVATGNIKLYGIK